MHTVELSNHPGRLLAVEAARREAERSDRQASHRRALAEHAECLARLEQRRATARADRRLLAWLAATVSLRRLRADPPKLAAPPPGSAAESFQRRQRIEAGARGEQLLADELAARLDDGWILFRGYRNRRGEIDHLLLGPVGVIAVEVKYRNATVSCDGDAWSYVKYDRYGNQVEHGALCDRAGRSPSQQLNEPADALEELLARRGRRLRIARLLIFNHPRAALDQISGPTVDLGTGGQAVLELIDGMEGDLSADRVARIEQLILRDHQLSQPRRRQAG